MRFLRTRWFRWSWPVALGVLVYFGNVEVQTHLGRRTLERTGLEMLGLEAALARAQAEDKRVLADLSAIWCPTCRRLDGNVLADARVKQAIDDGFVFARLEYESDEGKAFAREHGLRGYPNLVILDADGSLVERLPLTFDPERFVELLGAASVDSLDRAR